MTTKDRGKKGCPGQKRVPKTGREGEKEREREREREKEKRVRERESQTLKVLIQ